MKKPRRTKAQKALIERVKAGAKICQQNVEPPFFIDGGGQVNARIVRSLLRDGVLKPAGDGLFAGFTQTLVLA